MVFPGVRMAHYRKRRIKRKGRYLRPFLVYPFGLFNPSPFFGAVALRFVALIPFAAGVFIPCLARFAVADLFYVVGTIHFLNPRFIFKVWREVPAVVV